MVFEGKEGKTQWNQEVGQLIALGRPREWIQCPSKTAVTGFIASNFGQMRLGCSIEFRESFRNSELLIRMFRGYVRRESKAKRFSLTMKLEKS
jgi:hypothetical protein